MWFLGSGRSSGTECILAVLSLPVDGFDEKGLSAVEPAEDDKGLCGVNRGKQDVNKMHCFQCGKILMAWNAFYVPIVSQKSIAKKY